MKKKGFQLSLNVIVVAILALVVLVSSTVFFANKFGMTSGELSKCASYNGECVESDTCNGRVLDASCEGQDGDDCCVTASSMAGGEKDDQEESDE